MISSLVTIYGMYVSAFHRRLSYTKTPQSYKTIRTFYANLRKNLQVLTGIIGTGSCHSSISFGIKSNDRFGLNSETTVYGNKNAGILRMSRRILCLGVMLGCYSVWAASSIGSLPFAVQAPLALRGQVLLPIRASLPHEEFLLLLLSQPRPHQAWR